MKIVQRLPSFLVDDDEVGAPAIVRIAVSHGGLEKRGMCHEQACRSHTIVAVSRIIRVVTAGNRDPRRAGIRACYRRAFCPAAVSAHGFDFIPSTRDTTAGRG